MHRTYYPKADEVTHEWYVIDASGQILGRLAAKVATLLMGKHKPAYTPGVDMGDFVIVINADRVRVTGRKLTDKKYYRHSGYPGGIKETALRDMLRTHPERVIELAVKGMLPKNRLGRKMLRRLKVYAGPEHPHEAQRPKVVTLD
ncbi:MAG: 50S ribosomal protein L13 [Chloroflexi bacterium]|nr:50S ribosomal protein L13 [Chloroflexota bacterium]